MGRIAIVMALLAAVAISVPTGGAGALQGDESGDLPGISRADSFDWAEIHGYRRVEAGDEYAAALAVGDFNGDGVDDIAVGSPGEDVGSTVDVGMVVTFHGEMARPNSLGRYPQHLGEVDSTLLQPGELVGLSEAGDRVGSALAVGDFDGDGFDDLAIGAPGEDLGPLVDAGAVFVSFGSADGLAGSILVVESMSGVYLSEPGDRFGHSLAAGDFDGDGKDELVVGAPDETVLGNVDAGMVSIFGFATDRSVAFGEQFYQGGGSLGALAGAPAPNHRYGFALVVDDLNDDGFADLAVGAPGHVVNGLADAGSAHVLFGGSNGLEAGDLLFVDVAAEADAQLGLALTIGSFGSGPTPQRLVVGVPGRSAGGVPGAGAALVFDTAGPVSQSPLVISQDEGDGNPETGDAFGSALTVGDFDRDGNDDLVVGAPAEDIGTVVDAGAVSVFWGEADGLSAGPGRLLWQRRQPFVGGQAGRQSLAEAGDRYGSVLAAGDFTHDTVMDLAVGVPQEALGPLASSGALDVRAAQNWGSAFPQYTTVTGTSPGELTLTVDPGDFPTVGTIDLYFCADRRAAVDAADDGLTMLTAMYCSEYIISFEAGAGNPFSVSFAAPSPDFRWYLLARTASGTYASWVIGTEA